MLDGGESSNTKLGFNGKTMVGRRPFKETTVWDSRGRFLVILPLGLIAAPPAVAAQPLAKVPLIGVLDVPAATPSPSAPFIQRYPVFGPALRDLGYVEGQNIAFAYRYAEG